MYFWNYGLQKMCLNKCLKNPVSQDTLESSMVNGNKECWNLDGTTFSIVIDDCEGNWVGKKSLLLICKVLKLFVNALTARDKSSLCNRDDLTQPIHMQLSKKEETLSQFFFFAFMKSTINFQRFPKKEDPHSWCIPEITNSENCAWINV